MSGEGELHARNKGDQRTVKVTCEDNTSLSTLEQTSNH